MTTVYSFSPLSDGRAESLILGSMPGKASLRANQYYAHPHNAFWSLMESIFGIDRKLAYAQRCKLLTDRSVAVWDVLKMCTRESSLDSDIVASSVVINDFENFYLVHPSIRRVYFNGAMAEKSYRQHVLPNLPETMARMPLVRLPSTSPAHAALSIDQKLALWKQIKSV